MNFGQILSMVTSDGIDQSERSNAQEWVRMRHAALWDWKDWTFKYAQAPITFTSGQQVLNSGDYPSDLHDVLAMYDQYGEPIRGYRDVRQFFDRYNVNALPVTSSSPEAYTMLNGGPLVGPMGNGSAGIIVYEKNKPSLINDSDLTGLPDGFDLALVHGAKATGMQITNNPLAQTHEMAYETIISELENGYLTQVLETGEQSGAYRPGAGYFPWW